jgi:hypothetical protein
MYWLQFEKRKEKDFDIYGEPLRDEHRPSESEWKNCFSYASVETG